MRLLLVSLLMLSGIACSDDTSPPPPPSDSGIPRDTSSDATDPLDGTQVDAALRDASADGPPMAVECETTKVEFARDPITRARVVSTTTTADGFLFAWSDAQSIRDEVRVARLGYEGGGEAAIPLTADDNSARAVDVADGFVVWLDDGGTGENAAVVGKSIDADATPRTLSTGSAVHASPRLFRDGDGWLATWLRASGGGWVIEMRSFDAFGESALITLPFFLPSTDYDVALAPGAAYFAWPDGTDALVAKTDRAGSVTSTPESVSDEHNADGGVALAFENDVGLVAFTVLIGGVRSEVRARLLDVEGRAMRPERVVSHAPIRGRAPSAIAFGGGYAIGYRAGTLEGDAIVALAFVHGTDGDVVAESELGPSSFEDGPPGLAVGAGGILAVGWAYRDPSAGATATEINGARLSCGEAWLRCGVMP